MYKKAVSLLLLFSALTYVAIAQVTYVPLNSEEYDMLDRLETKSGNLSGMYLGTKPVSRRDEVNFLLEQQKNARFNDLSKIDRFNISRMISKSGEWAPNGDGAIDSKLPWFHTFYKKQTNLVHVNTDNFFLVVNPVIGVQLLKEKDNPRTRPSLYSPRGVEMRGRIFKKVGFYTYFTDVLENPPLFVDNWVVTHEAVPGGDYYKNFKYNEYDYILSAGYIDLPIWKENINLTLGYDKHFIGDGMTSLFLSDFSAGSPFARLTARLGKFKYQSYFLELIATYPRVEDRTLPVKYATMHHLSINATHWLNVGLFESTIFAGTNNFSISNLNPIILYRAVGTTTNSPDNESVGLDFKAIAAKHLQFYGQFLFNGLHVSSFFDGNNSWENTWAAQAGIKYFDALTVKNLDLQAEVNVVRPYTYAGKDSIANYLHYNQPMTNPIGSNFIQVAAIAKYQPVKNLFLSAKAMYYMQGVDTGSSNYGGNPFLNTDTRSSNINVPMLNGVHTNCMAIDFNISYEIKPNVFIDLGGATRRYNYQNDLYPSQNTSYVYGGLRLNVAGRRNYTFY